MKDVEDEAKSNRYVRSAIQKDYHCIYISRRKYLVKVFSISVKKSIKEKVSREVLRIVFSKSITKI